MQTVQNALKDANRVQTLTYARLMTNMIVNEIWIPENRDDMETFYKDCLAAADDQIDSLNRNQSPASYDPSDLHNLVRESLTRLNETFEENVVKNYFLASFYIPEGNIVINLNTPRSCYPLSGRQLNNLTWFRRTAYLKAGFQQIGINQWTIHGLNLGGKVDDFMSDVLKTRRDPAYAK